MYNIAAYSVYLALVLVVVIHVGGFLYRNGRYFLQDLLGEAQTATAVNNLLYAGYCLVNAGGAFNCLYRAESFNSFTSSFIYIATQLGYLLLVLAILHYLNLGFITILKITKHKKTISHGNRSY